MVGVESGIEAQLEMRRDALYQTVQRFRAAREPGIIRSKVYQIFPSLKPVDDDSRLAIDFGLLYGSIASELGLSRFEALHITDASVFQLQHTRTIDRIAKKYSRSQEAINAEQAEQMRLYGDLLKHHEGEHERFSGIIEKDKGVSASHARLWLSHIRDAGKTLGQRLYQDRLRPFEVRGAIDESVRRVLAGRAQAPELGSIDHWMQEGLDTP